MKHTGIFYTSNELEEIKHAMNRPFIKIAGRWPESALEVSHRLALKHGLPKIEGYYGCDLRTGEILEASND